MMRGYKVCAICNGDQYVKDYPTFFTLTCGMCRFREYVFKRRKPDLLIVDDDDDWENPDECPVCGRSLGAFNHSNCGDSGGPY